MTYFISRRISALTIEISRAGHAFYRLILFRAAARE